MYTKKISVSVLHTMDQETLGPLSYVTRFCILVDSCYLKLCCLICKLFHELHKSKSKRYLFIAFVIAIVLTVTLTQRSTKTPSDTPSVKPSDHCYAKAAVAADAGVCSTIGRDMLKRNGSAVDAAIAALLCVSLFNAHSMGIGGGGVFTIYNASTEVETIDARETAPKNALQNISDPDLEKSRPGLFIAVPGELRGYELAHKRHGRLQWRELFEPSIKLALEGFKIGRALAETIKDNEDMILNSTTWCEVFCNSNNTILKENDTIRFPQLALTYKRIAEKGPDTFYDGSLTQNIVDDINAAGGNITFEDLKNYQPVLNEHACNYTVGKYIFHTPYAPFGGPVLALILNVLKGYNLTTSNVSTTENKILTYHHIIETFRAAYEERSKLGDPHGENITDFIQKMTSDSFADFIRSEIKDDTERDSYDEQDENIFPNDFGTSHLSIIAEDGSAVAVTSSINERFGSKVMSRSTGIIFNNQIQDFTDFHSEKSHNLIKPGKRPLSSMSPTIILDKLSKQVKMVVGASGGTKIISATAQVILNYMFFDYDVQKAINEPRAHNQFSPNETLVEDGFDENVTDGLKLKNHTISKTSAIGKVQAVVREKDVICAASDPRKGGYPDGY
ncbi:glutathione hydrolase 1 proenzyme isoform X2 [Labeo rohita]|uniref:glutathione hydrolase 1 proenzyme isoform X2 n=1 Tax=Labeo rohita TaxID=84645 RepID=UPI0021E2A1F3|nr:glutathione hydrolase 1 proenzyme isoform X2 [Labeo rohita]